MTRSEWFKVVAVLQARWPQKAIPPESAEVWFTDLEEFPVDQVTTAVGALYRDGREWAPNGAQIRNKLIELRAGDRDWSRAYELAMEAARSHGGAEYGGLTWLRGQDELAARAAETYGWREFCLSDAPDTTKRAQFRDIFGELAGSAERHERYRGLPSAGLKVLEQANEPTKLGDLIQIESGEEAA